MKFNILACLVFLSLTLSFIACDDNTDEMGTSLIARLDNIEIMTDTFYVTTQSIKSDSVYSRTTTSYIGKIRDPETGSYVTSDFITQFYTMTNTTFPDLDTIASFDANGEVIADSCVVRMYYEDYYGDSLATMKLTVYEMATPMAEGVVYYSNFDPLEEGMVREDGLTINRTYTLIDYNVRDSIRLDDDYMTNVKIKLDKEYTDVDGNTYNNYGTYLIRKYYENPEYFRNSYKFIHYLCPGFLLKHTGGLGSMTYISKSQMSVHFRYIDLVEVYDDDDELVYDDDGNVVMENDTINGYVLFAGTEEVLQCTKTTNDDNVIDDLVADNTCTYLKTPAGIFTEITLPIDEIMDGHENDTINSAKIVLQRINNTVNSKYSLDIPQTLLLIPKSEIYTFFENREVADYKTSFLATYSETYNTYTFNNIGALVKHMYEEGMTDDDWNKVVVIPVITTYDSSSNLTNVAHDMSLASTKLVGGSENPYDAVKISMIYSKFK